MDHRTLEQPQQALQSILETPPTVVICDNREVKSGKPSIATESRFPTITAKELADEITLEEFEIATTKELVEESYGPIRFPKIRVKIYHDLPIPEAQIDSKLVRIGDKISE